jgi:hypothetical protein
MDIALRNACQEIIKTEASRKSRFHNELAILGRQAHFSTSAKANFLCQSTRDPHSEAVSPFLNSSLHGHTTAILGVYQLWGSVAPPPSL